MKRIYHFYLTCMTLTLTMPMMIVSAVMFFAGVYGFITRRNLIAVLISIELILNAVDINFAVFNRYLFPGQLEGFFFTIFAIAASMSAESQLARM